MTNGYSVILVCAVCFAMFGFGVVGLERRTRYPISLQHEVLIYGQLPNGDWAMRTKEEGNTSFRPCPGEEDLVNGVLKDAAGYVAYWAKWEERGTCRSIRATGLLFDFIDKDHPNYTMEKIQ